MKIIRTLGLVAFALFNLADTSWAATPTLMRDSVYRFAKSGNAGAMFNLKATGASLDATDDNGNTALCQAMVEGNTVAYEMLKDMGADTAHPCVSKSLAAGAGVAAGSGWSVSGVAIAGAAVVAAGAGVAAAAGGGGGGGSSGKPQANDNVDEDNPTPGGGDDDDDDTGNPNIPDSVHFWETKAYYGGNFLSKMHAAYAYSRIYGTDTSTRLNKVGVGIIDTGVDVYHPQFDYLREAGSISQYNYDYGPCHNGKTQNCWRFSTGTIPGTSYNHMAYAYINGDLRIVNINETDFNTWAADFPLDYDWESVQEDVTPLDGKYHGTHVAGIIAGGLGSDEMHGVAFENVDLGVVKWDFMSDLYDPVSKLIDEGGVKVINLSFGAAAGSALNAKTVLTDPGILGGYLDTYRKAALTDTILVFSAGNESYEQPSVLVGAPLIESFRPGEEYSLENLLIAVVALNEQGNGLASFSNQCGVAKNYCIAAPGSNVHSTDIGGGYRDLGGTSMAAPAVTGSIALLLGAYPYMTTQEVTNLIFETARDMGASGVDEVYGHGALDLDAATDPQGPLSLISTNSVNDTGFAVNSTMMNVPAVFQGAMLKAMPKHVTAFDKYNRPFAVSTADFVKATNAGKQNFKNDLYAFSKHNPVKRTVAENGISFGFAPSSFGRSENGLGFADVNYEGDGNTFRFFYAENTKYGSDKYFDQNMLNPYLSMNQAYGMENSYTLSGGKLGFKFGFATGENGLYDGGRDYNDYDFEERAYAFSNEISYNLTNTFMISALNGVLYEDSAVLGLNGSGAFDVNDSDTYYAGVSFGWKPTDKLSFSGVYYQGWTNTQNSDMSMMQTGKLASDSFAFDGRYELNKQDLVGVQLSSPLRIYKGTASFDLPVGRDNYSDTVYRQRFSASMKPDAREYKLSLYHMREASEDLNFKTQFDIRLNPEHQKNAETDYRIMFGLNYTF